MDNLKFTLVTSSDLTTKQALELLAAPDPRSKILVERIFREPREPYHAVLNSMQDLVDDADHLGIRLDDLLLAWSQVPVSSAEVNRSILDASSYIAPLIRGKTAFLKIDRCGVAGYEPSYEPTTQIAKSTWGTIYNGCRINDLEVKEAKGIKRRDCDYAIKVQNLDTLYGKEVAESDLRFIRILQKYTYRNADGRRVRIVPQLKAAWMCTDSLSMVLDYWQKNMLQVGKENYNRYATTPELKRQLAVYARLDPAPRLIYKAKDLYTMYLIARRLDELKVVSSDLKADQFLVKGRLDVEYLETGLSLNFITDEMVVTDFGFTTKSQGWDKEFFGCANDLPRTQANFNVWQLEMDLIYGHGPTLVEQDDHSLLFFVGWPIPNYAQLTGLCKSECKECAAHVDGRNYKNQIPKALQYHLPVW